jgi:hypothetical protein
LELLACQQSQRVAHQRCDPAAAVFFGRQTAAEGCERDQTEVGLCFSAAGGKPEEVSQFSLVALGTCNPLEAEQNEAELEGTPSVPFGLLGSCCRTIVGEPIRSGALGEHCLVHEHERGPRSVVLLEQLQARSHPPDSLVAVDEMSKGGFPIVSFERVDFGTALLYPARVSVAEGAEVVDDVGPICRRKPLHCQRTRFDRVVAVGEKKFVSRHER